MIYEQHVVVTVMALRNLLWILVSGLRVLTLVNQLGALGTFGVSVPISSLTKLGLAFCSGSKTQSSPYLL